MRVFLSHSNEDNDIAQKVRNYLVHQDLDVFDDKSDIATGSNLKASINKAISDSNAVIFFVSKNSEKSQLVQHEISLAVSNRLKGKNVKLIPLVLDANAEIPFFLKDYMYLDLSRQSDFDKSMKKLIEGIKCKHRTSVREDLDAKVADIEIQKAFLELKSKEQEEIKKFKTRQMFFVSMMVTLISAIGFSVALLAWVAKIEYSDFEWIIAFLVGSIATMFGFTLYMRKEKSSKEEINKKISDLNKMIKELGVRNEQ